ncbi:N-acetylmuramoyl-L-alanine amidase [Pseudanabaena sp. UWO311]|uniref:N-acetylmuramoyl-L-alanine amidase n=1 Tax=Pseudanabaena sp. UWO311 TaxID=2487337 RepID=UPI001158DFD8|nr:N-acetylmuramoyl-L-alanine amidase [Pseudanabaena sp. UWO311]TYQ25398.1 N-acetylmuramoyl-L-alanine amidase [Pseudanabaena sp. UWO311]
MSTQSVNAQVDFDLPLQDTNLQAQLPSSIQQLQLRNVQVSADGLVLQINGIPKMSASRIASPDRIILDLQTTEVAPWIHNSLIAVNRYGVKQIRVAQFQKSPAIARLVFDLDNNSPASWQSSFDQTRGLLVLRPLGISGTSNNPSNLPVTGSTVANNNLATTIDGLSFNGYGQLVIQASRAISYRTSLDLATNTYNVTIPSTRISSQLRRPILGSNSPIEQIRLNQVGDAVVVSVKALAGWQIRETARTNTQAISLQLESVGQVATGNPQNPRSQIQPSYSNNNGRQLVVIDPGHGGPDVGATRNGVYEKDIVLAMSKQLGRILQQMGYSVMYTRTEDIDLDLEPRVQMAENARASAFVSVHVNSLDASASQVNGVETYHAPGASLGKNLAEFVHEQIIASTGATDRGVRSARFHVIVNTSMPAILVETGFITNPSEAARLVNSSYQERMAAAIAKGIDQFLRSYRR